jgi:hypothetical protein
MSRVGAYSAMVFCAVLVIELVAARSGWFQLAGIAGWAAAGVVALGLLVSFVYAVTMPDVLLERHSARGHRDRNRIYLGLVALGAAANAFIIIVTLALILSVSVALKLLRI